jgi:nucleoid DNA-binding protein
VRDRKNEFRYKVADELTDLLDLPRGKFGRPDKAHQIIRAIQTAMTDALHRGEDIRIDGFGIFRIHTRPSKPNRQTFIMGRPAIKTSEIVVAPARKVVKFTPSEALRAMVNIDAPTTCVERRAIKSWK